MAQIFTAHLGGYAPTRLTSVPVGGRPSLDPGAVHIYRLQCSTHEKLYQSVAALFAIFKKQPYVRIGHMLRYDKATTSHGIVHCMDFIYRVDDLATLGIARGHKAPIEHPDLGDLLTPVDDIVLRAPVSQSR